MSRPAHRHHQSSGPPYTGLHTGRHRNPAAGKLVIHRPGQPDEILSTAEFRKRTQQTAEADAASDDEAPPAAAATSA